MLPDDFFHAEYQRSATDFFVRQLLVRAGREDPGFLDHLEAEIETYRVPEQPNSDRTPDALMWRIYQLLASRLQAVREEVGDPSRLSPTE